jgi:hypothetical protein
MKFEFTSRKAAISAIEKIIGCINDSGSTTNVVPIAAFVPAPETWHGC